MSCVPLRDLGWHSISIAMWSCGCCCRLHHPQLRLKDALLSAYQKMTAQHEAYGKQFSGAVLKVRLRIMAANSD